MALKDTEYMYISARIKAKEGQTTYSERVNGYLGCKSLDELYSLIMTGEEPVSTDKRDSLEAHFDKRVREAFALVRESAPDPKCFDFLLYEYDACNVKALIKCMLRQIDSEGLLYEYATVLTDELKEAFAKRSFDEVLPKNMASAVPEAIEAYKKTGDARIIDFIIDKACFADMLENARLCGCKLATDIVKQRIDSINIITLERIASSELADKVSTFDMAFLEGGEISKQSLAAVLEKENFTVVDALDGSEYKDIVRSLSDKPFSALEKILDERELARVNDEKYVPFGFEVVCLYLINTLFEAKNARIIIAGLASGLSEEKIRERVRV